MSTTREQRVINMAVPRGSVSRRYLQLYLGVFGFNIPRTPSGSIYRYSVIYTNCGIKVEYTAQFTTIVYGAWTARSVSVPAVMNQMVTRVKDQCQETINIKITV